MAGSKRGIAKRIGIALAVVALALVALFAWYVGDYYHADEVAMAELARVEAGDEPSDGVMVRELPNGAIAFEPKTPIAGLIFYPGGKVQPEAYAPLMRRLADRGVLCILLKPPFNLAIFDVDGAAAAREQFPNVDKWVLVGHSLGGVAMGDYAARHVGELDALVFLASYPIVDLTQFPGRVLSVVGSEDGVLNRENYEAAREKLPDQARELVIQGGNHASYGNYGDQEGDGEASISRERQQEEVVDAIMALVG